MWSISNISDIYALVYFMQIVINAVPGAPRLELDRSAGVPDRASQRLFSRNTLVSRAKYTEISQKIMSAASARYMIFFLAALANLMLSRLDGDACENFRFWAAGVCFSLASMEQIMLSSPRYMSPRLCSRYKQLYETFRCGYNRLALRSVELKQLRWHVRPKVHQMEHAVYDFLPLNPRYFHNFLNEDFVRRAKALAIKSHPNWMARHVLFRYMLQFCLRWRD